MTVILVESGNQGVSAIAKALDKDHQTQLTLPGDSDPFISVAPSEGFQVIESATSQDVEFIPTTPFPFSYPCDIEWLFRDYGNPYHSAHGHQALFWRYDPKSKHNQIKPRKGYKLKRFNRKSFRKTYMNFR